MFQRYRQLIPALLLAACCLSTVIIATKSTIVVDNQHYAAFTLVLLSLGSFFFFRQYYRYFLGGCLFLGLLNLIYFTVFQANIGFGFGALAIRVNLIPLLVGLVTYVLNFQRVNSYLLDLIKPSPTRRASIQQEEIVQFKERFTRKSTEELVQLIAANKLVPAALTAARQLLQERT
jgi:hypothetical protein